MAEEGDGTLRGEDEATLRELVGSLLVVVGSYLMKEGGGVAHHRLVLGFGCSRASARWRSWAASLVLPKLLLSSARRR